jgi:hypothetical protein
MFHRAALGAVEAQNRHIAKRAMLDLCSRPGCSFQAMLRGEEENDPVARISQSIAGPHAIG